MPGLVPGIHGFLTWLEGSKTWMAGTSPAMTECYFDVCVSGALRQELQQQFTDAFRLLLLDPVTRARNEVTAAHLRAGSLHLLQVAGLLIDAPVVGAGDEA